MARSGARRKPRPKTKSRGLPVRARTPRTQPRPIEETLFFPRLIRSAKWMFVFLALVFGVGFVAFGVGSGQGTGLSDILQGNFGGSSVGPSLGKARDKVAKNPNDPVAQRDLGNALVNEGRQDEAITVFERYLQLRPKDVEVKRTLAALYLTKANNARFKYDEARLEALSHGGGGLFGPAPDTQFGRALGGRIDQEFEAMINERLSAAATTMQASFSRAATIYEQVVATHPDDEALLQLQLGDAAYQGRRVPLALKAYKRFLKIAPDDSNAAYAKQQIAILQSSANVQPG
jgi:tetratricopeptide (TPR) repeat protein